MLRGFGKIKLLENFYPNLKRYVDKETRYLEIGVCSGFTALWMLENILTHNKSYMIGIDPWNKNKIGFYKVRSNIKWNRLLKNIDNIKNQHGNKVKFIKGYSQDILREERFKSLKFDIIYIDGLHTPERVIDDFNLTWNMLNTNGIMIFDDYIFKQYQDKINAPIKNAIDDILIKIDGKYKLLFKNYQVGIEKII